MLIRAALDAGLTVVEEFLLEGEAPVSDSVMHRLDTTTLERVASTVSPQPHIAVVAQPSPISLSGVVDGWVLVADRVQDPGNLGTMIRSAVAAGAAAVITTPGTVDPFSPKVVRASAGALFYVPCIEVGSLFDVGAAGFTTVGTSSHAQPGCVDHDAYDFVGRIALVMGNEAAGLESDVPIDAWVTIAQVGPVESLNVAMATTVIAFEIARQRKRR